MNNPSNLQANLLWHISSIGFPVVLMLMLMGCGGFGVDPVDKSNEDSLAEECNYCGIEGDTNDHEIPSPQSLVVDPEELLFYYEFGSDYPDYELLTVTNYENKGVTIEAINIGSNRQSHISGDGSSEMFTFASPALPYLLNSNSSMTIQVSFAESTQQQSAFLFIDTTSEKTPQLVVSLAGKIFK